MGKSGSSLTKLVFEPTLNPSIKIVGMDVVNEVGLALSSGTRVPILLTVLGAPELSVGEIASELTFSPSTISFHLTSLERAGLIERRKRGRRTVVLGRADRWRRLRDAALACASVPSSARAPSNPS